MTNTEPGVSLKICSFNLLAPCYYRIQYHKRESSLRDRYLKRCNDCISFLKDNVADIYCFQEFWFNEEYFQLFKDAFENEYNIFSGQRPHKADGLLVLVKKNLIIADKEPIPIQVKNTKVIKLTRLSNRIALFLSISIRHHDFILVTTHLSFPHGMVSNHIQKDEAENICTIIKKDLIGFPVILCGDLNADEDSPVYQIIKLQGYISTHAQIHQREPKVSHKNHLKEDVLADYILYRNPSSGTTIKPLEVSLLPENDCDSVWPNSFTISDHRPIAATIQLNTCTNKKKNLL